MSTPNVGVASAADNTGNVGFAKLVGEEFEFLMQAYEMILGRNTKKGNVDLDLSVVGGGKDISHHHARIFYDFEKHDFFIEVLGRRGCTVQGTIYIPGDGPVKLKSQDLIQIGELKMYFLLPRCSILESLAARHTHMPSQPMPSSFVSSVHPHSSAFRGHLYGNGHNLGNGDNGTRVGIATQGMLINQSQPSFGELSPYSGRINVEPIGTLDEHANSVNIRTDKDTCNQQLQLKEEKDIITYVATLLSNNCGPGEWMPVEKLHSELIDHFSKIWPGSKVQEYLTPEDGPSTGTICKPWYSLLELLKKHPEHFVISTVCRGTSTSEFVLLDSLLI